MDVAVSATVYLHSKAIILGSFCEQDVFVTYRIPLDNQSWNIHFEHLHRCQRQPQRIGFYSITKGFAQTRSFLLS
jgi:hypothetical protein